MVVARILVLVRSSEKPGRVRLCLNGSRAYREVRFSIHGSPADTESLVKNHIVLIYQIRKPMKMCKRFHQSGSTHQRLQQRLRLSWTSGPGLVGASDALRDAPAGRIINYLLGLVHWSMGSLFAGMRARPHRLK